MRSGALDDEHTRIRASIDDYIIQYLVCQIGLMRKLILGFLANQLVYQVFAFTSVLVLRSHNRALESKS